MIDRYIYTEQGGIYPSTRPCIFDAQKIREVKCVTFRDK